MNCTVCFAYVGPEEGVPALLFPAGSIPWIARALCLPCVQKHAVLVVFRPPSATAVPSPPTTLERAETFAVRVAADVLVQRGDPTFREAVRNAVRERDREVDAQLEGVLRLLVQLRAALRGSPALASVQSARDLAHSIPADPTTRGRVEVAVTLRDAEIVDRLCRVTALLTDGGAPGVRDSLALLDDLRAQLGDLPIPFPEPEKR